MDREVKKRGEKMFYQLRLAETGLPGFFLKRTALLSCAGRFFTVCFFMMVIEAFEYDIIFQNGSGEILLFGYTPFAPF
ncbi:hypothetical protein DT075_07575 [Bacillus licheniformis]|nr:hypothetical protein DT075_07575 [Bacillus licheniformis]